MKVFSKEGVLPEEFAGLLRGVLRSLCAKLCSRTGILERGGEDRNSDLISEITPSLHFFSPLVHTSGEESNGDDALRYCC